MLWDKCDDIWVFCMLSVWLGHKLCFDDKWIIYEFLNDVWDDIIGEKLLFVGEYMNIWIDFSGNNVRVKLRN